MVKFSDVVVGGSAWRALSIISSFSYVDLDMLVVSDQN